MHEGFELQLTAYRRLEVLGATGLETVLSSKRRLAALLSSSRG